MRRFGYVKFVLEEVKNDFGIEKIFRTSGKMGMRGISSGSFQRTFRAWYRATKRWFRFRLLTAEPRSQLTHRKRSSRSFTDNGRRWGFGKLCLSDDDKLQIGRPRLGAYLFVKDLRKHKRTRRPAQRVMVLPSRRLVDLGPWTGYFLDSGRGPSSSFEADCCFSISMSIMANESRSYIAAM